MGATFLEQFDNFLVDCDGVLWRGDVPIKGASEAILGLKQHNKKVIFVSNNCAKPLDQYVTKFAEILQVGQIPLTHIYTSGVSTAKYIKNKINPATEKVFLIGTPGLAKTLSDAGIATFGLNRPPDHGPHHWKDWVVDESVRYVVVSYDPLFNHSKLTEAYLYLKENGAEFIAPDSDAHFSATDQRKVPGTLMMQIGLSTLLNRVPLVLGKPERPLFDLIQQEHGQFDPTRTIMIGDNYNTDMMFGFNCGIKTALVLTGNAKRDDVDGYERTPDFVLDGIADVLMK